MGLSAKTVVHAPYRGDVFVVDDDQSVRDSLCMILELEGFRTQGIVEGRELLDLLSTDSVRPACVVLDFHMPDMSGLDVLTEMSRRGLTVPVIMMSGANDLPMAVESMKRGARDFIQKPFMAAALIDRIDGIVESNTQSSEADLANKHGLTPREQDVLFQIVQGSSNKEAGRTLGISPRTVEVHRAHVMSKLGAKNTADLMRIILSHAESKNRRTTQG